MPCQITIYSTDDFIRKTPTGGVSLEKSIETVRKLAQIAEEYPDHNVLLDLRKIEGYLTFPEMGLVIEEFIRHTSVFTNKIATLVSVDEKRMARALHGLSILTTRGFHNQIFVDYEDAIEWLSEVTQIDCDPD
jgi:hypothetical protein